MAEDALKDRTHAGGPAGSDRAARPRFRNIHVLDLMTYRLPLAGIVSILHRISGALMFLLLPFLLWMFDNSLSTEQSYERFTALFIAGVGVLPGGFIKLVALALIWAFLHHVFAGVRHLWMDMFHAVGRDFGRRSALATLVLSLALTAALGVRLFLS